MLNILTCIVALAMTAAVLTIPAESGSRKQVRAPQAPLKDCTRVNGRWGYYGNLWCSPAEQQAWDRAEARRLGIR